MSECPVPAVAPSPAGPPASYINSKLSQVVSYLDQVESALNQIKSGHAPQPSADDLLSQMDELKRHLGDLNELNQHYFNPNAINPTG